MEGAAALMGRLASALILGSQLLLVLVALAPNGTTAIWFMFVGTPLLVLGCGLGIVALRRRLGGNGSRRERAGPT